MKQLIVLFTVVWALPVSAGQVCLEKGTGKLIEYQSRGRPDTCTQNAMKSGYPAGQIEERTISNNEMQALLEQQVMQPAKKAREAKRKAKQQAIDSIRQKLNLSTEEFHELQEALRD